MGLERKTLECSWDQLRRVIRIVSDYRVKNKTCKKRLRAYYLWNSSCDIPSFFLVKNVILTRRVEGIADAIPTYFQIGVISQRKVKNTEKLMDKEDDFAI